MLVVFFDWQGVIHYEFIPCGQTVNKEFYVAVLKHLKEAVRQKRPQLWTNQSWVLHHDNAPAHLSFLVRNFLAKNETTVVPQPPYSPDLAPADFFMFSKLKSTVKGRCSDTPPEKFDEGVVHHSERSVPESVQKLAETLEAVFC